MTILSYFIQAHRRGEHKMMIKKTLTSRKVFYIMIEKNVNQTGGRITQNGFEPNGHRIRRVFHPLFDDHFGGICTSQCGGVGSGRLSLRNRTAQHTHEGDSARRRGTRSCAAARCLGRDSEILTTPDSLFDLKREAGGLRKSRVTQPGKGDARAAYYDLSKGYKSTSGENKTQDFSRLGFSVLSARAARTRAYLNYLNFLCEHPSVFIPGVGTVTAFE